MNIDDTTKWLTRFIGDKHGPKRKVYIEDTDRFGRVAVAADGYMMAIARVDEGVTGVPHPLEWTSIIPDTFSTSVTVPTEALVRAIMRADVVARHTQPTRPTRPTRRTRYTPHPVHLVIEPRVVRVRAEAHDIGQIETVIDAELDGSTVTITLDAKRVLTILRGWSSVSNGKRRKSSTLDGADETIIRVGQPDEIIMIQPADVSAAGGRFAMLMPLRKPVDDAGPADDAGPKPGPDPEPGPVTDAKPADDAGPKPDPLTGVRVTLPTLPALPAPKLSCGHLTDEKGLRYDAPAPTSTRFATWPDYVRHVIQHNGPHAYRLHRNGQPRRRFDTESGAPLELPGPVTETKPGPDPEPKPGPDRLTIHPKLELTPAKARRIVEHWSAVVEFAQTGTLARANGARLVHYDTCTVLDLGGKRNKYTQWKTNIIIQHEEVIRAYVKG